MNIPEKDDTPLEIASLQNLATDITEILDTIANVKGEGYAAALNTMFNVQTGYMVCLGLMGTPTTSREEAGVALVERLTRVTMEHTMKSFVQCLVPGVPETASDLVKQACVRKRNEMIVQMIDDLELLFRKHDQHVPVPK